MAVRLSVLAAEIIADAGAIATEIGGGRTEAEIVALGGLLDVLALRNDLAQNAMQLLSATDRVQISPT
jgi:actin-like ATPase involved in cell morphogenesis